MELASLTLRLQELELENINLKERVKASKDDFMAFEAEECRLQVSLPSVGRAKHQLTFCVRPSCLEKMYVATSLNVMSEDGQADLYFCRPSSKIFWSSYELRDRLPGPARMGGSR